MARTSLLPHLSPLRLLGPLADKELRVASRRRRGYVLRCGYIILLCTLMLSAWYQIVGRPTILAAFGTSRAAVVSAQVAYRVILFQFAASQLIAALMLSSSIGDEMRRGTLGVLLTTPITSVHVVAGKLLGGLLQVVLLLGIGLPALAALRLLGGLSWEQVFAAFWITFLAAVFAACLSLLLSTYYRHSFQAISVGAVVYLVLFVGLPFLVACLVEAHLLNPSVTLSILDLTNPFRALIAVAPRMGRGPTPGAGRLFSLPIHCLIMAGAAAVIVCLSVRRMRRVAVAGRFGRKRTSWAVERLWGSPVAWKIVLITAVLCVLLIVTRRGSGALMIYPYYVLQGLWLVVLLRLAIGTAAAIGNEKESGAWPVLLTTPLGEGQILRGKVRAALRRDGVMLLGLPAVEICLVCSLGGFRDRWLIVEYGLVRLGAVVLMLGAGLYFGVRLRTTTVAVAAALLLFLCVHYVLVGRYNPLWAWGWAKLIDSYVSGVNSGAIKARSNYLQLYSLAGAGAGFVLDMVLGLLLWRRARRNVRAYIF